MTIDSCPFCGNTAASRLDAITDVDAWVYCDACSACGPTKRTEAEAIAAWNSLAAQRPLVAAALEWEPLYSEWNAWWDGPGGTPLWDASRTLAQAARAHRAAAVDGAGEET